MIRHLLWIALCIAAGVIGPLASFKLLWPSESPRPWQPQVIESMDSSFEIKAGDRLVLTDKVYGSEKIFLKMRFVEANPHASDLPSLVHEDFEAKGKATVHITVKYTINDIPIPVEEIKEAKELQEKLADEFEVSREEEKEVTITMPTKVLDAILGDRLVIKYDEFYADSRAFRRMHPELKKTDSFNELLASKGPIFSAWNLDDKADRDNEWTDVNRFYWNDSMYYESKKIKVDDGRIFDQGAVYYFKDGKKLPQTLLRVDHPSKLLETQGPIYFAWIADRDPAVQVSKIFWNDKAYTIIGLWKLDDAQVITTAGLQRFEGSDGRDYTILISYIVSMELLVLLVIFVLGEFVIANSYNYESHHQYRSSN